MDRREKAFQVAWSFHGTPYIWGGDDFSGFDCSGYVLEILQSVGLVPHRHDTTAHGLYAMLANKRRDLPYRGCLVFWKRNGKMVHVEFCLDEELSIGASGGGSDTEDEADAIVHNAYVKVRPFVPRKGHAQLFYVDPFGDPSTTVDV